MKKTNYISRTVYHVLMVLPLLALTLLTACSEDETTFPDYEKDWFQLEDSSDPAQHAAYEFFKQYGIPIFFNDTIGTQQRVDVFGNEYTFYKTLTLNAAIGGGQSSYGDAFYNTFIYADRSVIPDAIQYLRTQLMPTIPTFLHIHSILLVEAINGSSDDVYVGLNTLVITKASLLASYQADQTKKLRAVVNASIVCHVPSMRLTMCITTQRGISTLTICLVVLLIHTIGRCRQRTRCFGQDSSMQHLLTTTCHRLSRATSTCSRRPTSPIPTRSSRPCMALILV